MHSNVTPSLFTVGSCLSFTLVVFRGSVLRQNTSKPNPTTGETQERYE